MVMFQFPSNGIIVPNEGYQEKAEQRRKVSIPFKRDNSSERVNLATADNKTRVSIPFKRDNSSELTKKFPMPVMR